MVRSRYAVLLPYLGAIAFVIAAIAFRFAFDPILRGRQPFAAFLVAVILAGRFCGFAPSLLALTLSSLASDYFFVAPRGSLAIAGEIEQASFAFFILIGLFFTFLMRSEQRAKNEAREQTTVARQQQQQAKNNEARLLLALEAGRMGCWSWDLSTNRVQSTETQAVLHGRSPDQTDTRIDDSGSNIHPDDQESVRAVIERAMRNDAQERITYRTIWPDGSVHWIEAIGRVISNETGTPTHVLGVCVDITDRKNAENALRESEERFRLLAMHAPVGIALCDAHGRALFVNPKSCEMVGASTDEVLGFDWQEFVHPDDRGRILESWQADIAAGKTHSSSEFRFARRDGTIRWAYSTASLIHDSQGTPIGQIGITEDITERRTAERRFRDIYDQAPLGIGLLDSHTGQFLQINPKYEQIIGRTESEMKQLTFQEITFPDDLADDLDQMALLLAGKIRRFQMEKRLMRGDGSVMWAGLTVVPMWQPDEAPTCHLALVEDITERKITADKLKERESQLSGILDNTTAIIYLKDSQGRYLLTNRRHQEVLQRDGRSIVGRTDAEFFPESIAKTFQEADAQVWRSQVPLDFEEAAPHADGPHTYRSVKFPVRDDAGRMISLGGISTDITDLKEAHDALKAEQELLRNLIELQEKQKQFMCHEFHDGLIQYAVGSLMLLEGCQNNFPATELTPTIDTVISNLRKGVEDGRRVIRGIRPAVLDDSGLEAAIVDLVEQYSTFGVHVTSHCDPEIGRLPNSVQTMVYRVVQEALNNAVKHSGTDVVRIDLKKNNGDLELEVQDFGCGFDVEAMRKKGFGLLSIRERVRLLGGDCAIHSELNTGTRISVRLPFPSAFED